MTRSRMVQRQEQEEGSGSREQVQSHFTSETSETGGQRVRMDAENRWALGSSQERKFSFKNFCSIKGTGKRGWKGKCEMEGSC